MGWQPVNQPACPVCGKSRFPLKFFLVGLAQKRLGDTPCKLRKRTPMKKMLLFALAVTAMLTAQPRNSNAHCEDMPHRHYAGRVFYIVCNRYYEPVWCDGCGTLRTLGGRPWVQKQAPMAKQTTKSHLPHESSEAPPPARSY
jgi:hypothetical protein